MSQHKTILTSAPSDAIHLPLWTYTDFFLTPLHPNSQHLLSPFQGKPLVYWNSHAPRVYRKTQFILLGHYMHVWGIWYCFAIWLSNSMQVASSLTFFFFFALSMIYFYDSLLTGIPLTYLFLREVSSWGACEKLAYLFSRRLGIILIPRWYGVHGTFLNLLYWNWWSMPILNGSLFSEVRTLV